MDIPKYLQIKKIISESEDARTFYFPLKLGSMPGQFVMLWMPGVDQKPFSVSRDDGEEFAVTVFNRGPLTKKLFECRAGDRVGVSGPYGTSFSVLPNRNYIMVAGGYGAAPLLFLAKEAIKLGSTVDFCVGARNKSLLLFQDELSRLNGVKIHIATDDGSAGHRGSVTNFLTVILNEAKRSEESLNFSEPCWLKNKGILRFAQDDSKKRKPLVCTCGPELMEKKVLDLCNQFNVDCEISVERYMKCGLGICGQCCVDDIGAPMCEKGPVINKETANSIAEFGQYHRDRSGAKIYYANPVSK